MSIVLYSFGRLHSTAETVMDSTLTKAWMVSKFIRSMGRSMINSATASGPPPNTKAWIRFRPLPQAEIVGRSIINEHY